MGRKLPSRSLARMRRPTGCRAAPLAAARDTTVPIVLAWNTSYRAQRWPAARSAGCASHISGTVTDPLAQQNWRRRRLYSSLRRSEGLQKWPKRVPSRKLLSQTRRRIRRTVNCRAVPLAAARDITVPDAPAWNASCRAQRWSAARRVGCASRIPGVLTDPPAQQNWRRRRLYSALRRSEGLQKWPKRVPGRKLPSQSRTRMRRTVNCRAVPLAAARDITVPIAPAWNASCHAHRWPVARSVRRGSPIPDGMRASALATRAPAGRRHSWNCRGPIDPSVDGLHDSKGWDTFPNALFERHGPNC